MPPYLRQGAVWEALWPFPVAVGLVTLLVCVCITFKSRAAALHFALPISAFSSLGLVVGYLTAFSREPAVGAVLPAILTFVGGVTVVLIQKDVSARNLVSLCVLIFTASLVLGTTWGGYMRLADLAYSKSEAEIMEQARSEARVAKYRRELGLSPCECQAPQAQPR